jgi:hypothetical protein
MKPGALLGALIFPVFVVSVPGYAAGSSFEELNEAFLRASVPDAADLQLTNRFQGKTLSCVTTSSGNNQTPSRDLRIGLKQVEDMPSENLPVVAASRGDFMVDPELGLIGNDNILTRIGRTDGRFSGVRCDNHVIPYKYIFDCRDTTSADEFGRGETDVAVTTYIRTPHLDYSTLKVIRTAKEASLNGLLIAENSRLAKELSPIGLPVSVAGDHRRVVSYEVCQIL